MHDKINRSRVCEGNGGSRCEGVGWPRGNDERLDVHECRSTPISLI